MLTARGDEYDRILGFETGADDYVVKPFSVREVVLRLTALSKRVHERSDAKSYRGPKNVLRLRDLEIDVKSHDVSLAGEAMDLRPLEFKLLVTLASEPGRVFSRGELLEAVWGLAEDTNTRTVDVHVKRLRTRLGNNADLIETVHGFGYRAKAV
jgi:DNA-binding response OmpR family regulator